MMTLLNREGSRLSVPCLFLVLIFGCLSARAATPSARLPAQFDLRAIDDFLTARVQEGSCVGLSIAIVREGQIVLQKGYGKRSLADDRLVQTDTLFAIGSVSKQFTCAALLLLAEEGKLSVQDTVAKYYPHLTRANDITLLDLMNHVSGYPDYYPLDFVDRRLAQPIDPDELLRRYAGGKLDFEPGSKWSYSNTGYILLGRVIEKVSGESLGSFLARRVFKPLGMDHTFYELEAADGRLARGYLSFLLSEPEGVIPEARGWLGGAGGLYSTPGDLAKWDLGLISGKVLKPESYRLMTTPRPLSDGKLSDYGCGLSLKVQGGRTVISHNGAVSGFNAWNGIIPSTRSAVIMTSNMEGGYGAWPNQIFALLLQENANVPSVRASSAPDIAKAVLAELQKGKVNRAQFGEEFNHYLTDEKIARNAKRLKSFGTPTKAELVNSHERGGMEVTSTRLTFKTGTLRVQMYRKPDGKIEQFFVSKE